MCMYLSLATFNLNNNYTVGSKLVIWFLDASSFINKYNNIT